MKCALLFTVFFVFAASISSSEGLECSDIHRCKVEFARGHRSESRKACSDMSAALSCYDDALEDCIKTRLSSSGMYKMTEERETLQNMLNDKCYATGTTCYDSDKCREEFSRYSQSNTREACGAMRSALSCYTTAVQECRVKYPNMVGLNSKIAMKARMEEMFSNNCGGGSGGDGHGSMSSSGGNRNGVEPSGAVTCENIDTCVMELAKVSQADMGEACGSMRTVLSCFKSALQDCRVRQPNMPNMDAVESQMANVEKMFNERCGSGGSISSSGVNRNGVEKGGATTCANINTCAMELAKVDQSNMGEACGPMRTVLSCFKSALQDCKVNHPNMPNIDAMESQMENVEKTFNDHCGSGGSISSSGVKQGGVERGGSMGCENIDTCEKEFTKVDQTNKEEACRAIRAVQTCLESGLKECKDKNPDRDYTFVELKIGELGNAASENCPSGAATVKMSITLLLLVFLKIFM